jgi:hypothetical protein
MTARRTIAGGSRLSLALALAAMLAACATVPEARLNERLDEATGVTVTTLDRPLEFFAPQPEYGIDAASFVNLGLAEADRMGTRTYYLWVSVLWGRVEPKGVASPELESITIESESAALTFDMTRRVASPSRTALYAPPANWSIERVFLLTVSEVRAIAHAQTLALTIETAGGDRHHFTLWKPPTPSLPLFADQLLDGAGQPR